VCSDRIGEGGGSPLAASQRVGTEGRGAPEVVNGEARNEGGGALTHRLGGAFAAGSLGGLMDREGGPGTIESCLRGV